VETGEVTQTDEGRRPDHCCRFLTFCDSHWRPSKRPSPVVAQLKTEVSGENKENGRSLLTSGAHTTSGRAYGAGRAFLSPRPET
jgi:hypothetical protein